MELYALYGVSIQTEWTYVYRRMPIAECDIPFPIDTSTEEEDKYIFLKVGVFIVDGDQIAPACL